MWMVIFSTPAMGLFIAFCLLFFGYSLFPPNLMTIIDTHAHLDFLDFDSDREEVLARAQKAGVKKIVNVGCTLGRSHSSVALAEKHENIFATVGVHPHDAVTVTPEALSKLKKLAQSEKVRAVGEIGLDYFKMRNSREEQGIALESQLQLAQDLNLPVVIHTREADEDILAILKKYPAVRGVVHCFAGSIPFAEKILALGFLISFTGIITFPKAEALREVVRFVPSEKIMLETDCPYLAPHSHRGKRNEPVHVVHVARKVAEIKGADLEEVAEQTTRNAEEFFKI
jgi:TatD DNase family protein